MDHLAKAKHYRDQAEHTRKLAQNDSRPDMRAGLLDVANTYHRLYLKYLALAGAGKPDLPQVDRAALRISRIED